MAEIQSKDLHVIKVLSKEGKKDCYQIVSLENLSNRGHHVIQDGKGIKVKKRKGNDSYEYVGTYKDHKDKFETPKPNKPVNKTD